MKPCSALCDHDVHAVLEYSERATLTEETEAVYGQMFQLDNHPREGNEFVSQPCFPDRSFFLVIDVTAAEAPEMPGSRWRYPYLWRVIVGDKQTVEDLADLLREGQ